MRKHHIIITIVAALSGFLCSGQEIKDKPNVVIIYADDVGYGDVGAYGAKLIPTPNLDEMAKDGLMFTDGHCSAATCTPSRFSMLTGIHGFRHGVRILAPNAAMTIKPSMFTLPQLFKEAGYQTAVIGKWHLGLGDGKTPVNWNGDVKPGPLEIGFDYSFLLPSTNDRVPCVYLENYRVVGLDPKDPLFVGKKPDGVTCTEYPDGKKNPEAMTYYKSTHGHNTSVINGIGRIGRQFGGKSALWNDETMADEFIKQTKKYISSRKKDQPFFLYFSSQDIHVPRAPHPRFKGKSKLSYRGDAMVQFDWAAGEIIKSLDENGFTDNTIVIFSSDNGPVYDDGYDDGTTVHTSTKEVDRGHDGSGPYRGGKYQIYEGGTRVPFIIKWPGNIQPGKSDALVNQIDLIASFATMLGVSLEADQGIDSRDIFSTLIGENKNGLDYSVTEAFGKTAIRKGHWKYIGASVNKNNKKKSQAGQLFNLSSDIGEQKNLIKEHPEIATELQQLLDKVIQAKGGIRSIPQAGIEPASKL
jgi:arylsulfatase A-like enzyme